MGKSIRQCKQHEQRTQKGEESGTFKQLNADCGSGSLMKRSLGMRLEMWVIIQNNNMQILQAIEKMWTLSWMQWETP